MFIVKMALVLMGVINLLLGNLWWGIISIAVGIIM